MPSMTSDRDRLAVRRRGWIAVYCGGAYIDVFHESHPEHALDCINVYDYAEGAPTIPFERRAIAAELKEWIDESSADVIEHQLPYIR